MRVMYLNPIAIPARLCMQRQAQRSTPAALPDDSQISLNAVQQALILPRQPHCTQHTLAPLGHVESLPHVPSSPPLQKSWPRVTQACTPLLPSTLPHSSHPSPSLPPPLPPLLPPSLASLFSNHSLPGSAPSTLRCQPFSHASFSAPSTLLQHVALTPPPTRTPPWLPALPTPPSLPALPTSIQKKKNRRPAEETWKRWA